MSENEIRVLYVQPGKYPEERTIPNTLRALQELVGGDIECCRPWRDSVCVICNDSGKIDGLPPNRLYGHTDFLAGSFVVCGNGGEDFISLTDDFGWPRNPDGYNKLVKRVAQKAGISDIHPHMFRHTFVSLLMSNPDIGVATVAAEAGHAQPSTTLMIYTQQYKKRRESIRNQLSRELYEK